MEVKQKDLTLKGIRNLMGNKLLNKNLTDLLSIFFLKNIKFVE